MRSRVRRIGPDAALCPVPGRPDRSAIYDDALVAMVALREGRRHDAGLILGTLAATQWSDGAIPFNVALDGEAAAPYVRSGALAWVGYAAVEYADAGRDGPHRDDIVRMAHDIARYLLDHQIADEGDPRAGLVTGGRGIYTYALGDGELRETFVDGERDWAAIEHNVDAFFFLRALGRVTGRAVYADAAARIGRALERRAWVDARDQLTRGIGTGGAESVFALDGASWGGLFLHAVGEQARAVRCLSAAGRYASSSERAPRVRGHKPYAEGPVIESHALRERASGPLRQRRWENFGTVWPEGSAGVALLAARVGQADRAHAILEALESARDAAGALPSATDEVPYELDTSPSLAGTAWVELVRTELAGGPKLWA
jgi:hypothetical protein